MEANLYETIKNNEIGTLSIAEATEENNSDTFVLVSTDKAVSPSNVINVLWKWSTKR